MNLLKSEHSNWVAWRDRAVSQNENRLPANQPVSHVMGKCVFSTHSYSKINQQFKHYKLYNFWSRSEGVWFSKLAKVVVRLLDEQELLAISQIHLLNKAEFGVKMSWEYNSKEESGHMSWCVDANWLDLVFTDKSLSSDSLPQIFDYQMVDNDQLVMASGKYEETILLDGNNRRLREHRYDGKLIRRLWENKREIKFLKRTSSVK